MPSTHNSIEIILLYSLAVISMSERCSDSKARLIADDLDHGRAHEASKKLYDCSEEQNRGLGYDPSKLQYLIEKTGEYEKKGVGLDLTIKYSRTVNNPLYLDGFEVR